MMLKKPLWTLKVVTATFTIITKNSEAQDAHDYIEDKLRTNFKKYNIIEIEQVYKVGAIINHDTIEGAYLVPIKLRKTLMVEHAAKNIQTSAGNFKLQLQNIHRCGPFPLHPSNHFL